MIINLVNYYQLMIEMFISGVPKNISLRKLSLEIYILIVTNLKSKY